MVITEADVERMREMRSEGMSLYKIARAFGVSRSAVTYRLKSYEERRRDNHVKHQRAREREGTKGARRVEPPSMSKQELRKVELTDADREKMRVIHIAQSRGMTPEEIDKKMHWRPGETQRQILGWRMARNKREDTK